MSIIKNNKNYGTRVKIEEIQPNPFSEYLTGHYMVSQASNAFKILKNTNNISGWRFKGDNNWETPATTISVNGYGMIEIEFNLTNNTVIKSGQFRDVQNLVKIDFPSTITTIEGSAFFNAGLMEFPVFTNVTSIGDDCFYSCIFNYMDYTINDNVNRSGWNLKSMNFHGNSNFGEKMYVNGVVYRIYKKFTQNGELDFSNGIGGLPIYKWRPYGEGYKWNLATMKFPATLTHVTGRAFQQCTITDLYFYGTTPPICETYDDQGIFYSSNITNIYVPASALTAYQNSADFADVVSKLQAIPE